MIFMVLGLVGGGVLGFFIGGTIGAVGGGLASAGFGLIAHQIIYWNDDQDAGNNGDIKDNYASGESFQDHGRYSGRAARVNAGSMHSGNANQGAGNHVSRSLNFGVHSPRERVDLKARNAFLSHLVNLMSAMARCDGVMRREEVKVIRSFLEKNLTLNADDIELTGSLLRQALRAPVDVDAALAGFTEGSRPAGRLLLIQALYEVGLGDGELSNVEQSLIKHICSKLSISEEDHRAIRNMFFDEPSSEHDYALLGVDPDIDEAGLKKAFRVMAARHHPDKVSHLGEDAAIMAGRRFSEINLAYERIRQARAAG